MYGPRYSKINYHNYIEDDNVFKGSVIIVDTNKHRISEWIEGG